MNEAWVNALGNCGHEVMIDRQLTDALIAA
jgi:hypothetical protein